MRTAKTLESEFSSAFNTTPAGKVRAPGRISLLGEHTDYNGGFVLSCALDITTTVAFKQRKDTLVRVRSLEYPGYMDQFDISAAIPHCNQLWANYIRGVFSVTRDYGFPLHHGLDLLVSSRLDQRAGLGSSAALSTSVIGAISKALSLPIDKRSLALIAQKAENDFLGKRCGIMDQFTATLGQKNNMLFIDCENLSVRYIALPPQLSIVVFNSCAKKNIFLTEYNDLREECERAAEIMNVKSLRHATFYMLNEHKNRMKDVTFRRARHIITENERVKNIVQALETLDTKSAYKLMFDSHKSMKLDFEITIPEIDALVDFCRAELQGNGGARMTGGGFGGSVIALCEHKYTKSLIDAVRQKYAKNFGIDTPAHVFRPANGLQISWDI
jgi:galactokinase